MTQREFDYEERSEQRENLARVTGRLASAIVEFFRVRLGQRFYVAELLAYVKEKVGEVAPDSPGRVMRLLRREKRINYVVVSRPESLYEVTPVS